MVVKYSFFSTADCGDLTDILNGGVSFNSTTEGSEVIYTCDAGYELKGENTRMCQSDGTWSGTEPQCEGIHNSQLHNSNWPL